MSGMSARHDSLEKLRHTVFLATFLSMASVALVLTLSFCVLGTSGYHERAWLSLLTYSRLSDQSLSDDDAQNETMLGSLLSDSDFAVIGVDAKGKPTSTSYSQDRNFLSKKDVEAITSQESTDGMWNGYLYHSEMTPWGGFYAVMDTTPLRKALAGLYASSSLLFLCLCGVMFAIARKLTMVIVRPAEDALLHQKQLAADLSHELKTPLAAIRANADLLEAKYEGSRELDAIQSETESMANLIGDLLTLAKLDEVDERASFTSLDFSAITADVCMVMDALLEERAQKLETHIEADVRIKGEKRHIQHLVSILMENAATHSPKGSTVVVTLAEHKNKAVLTVENPGDIKPEELSHLFDRFYQTDKESGERNFGLGLAIAKSITESHGGSIEAGSQDGKTRFTVRLPQ